MYETSLGPGALGAGSAICTGLRQDASRLQGVDISNLKYALEFEDKTANEGPLAYGFGVADSTTNMNAAVMAQFAQDPQHQEDSEHNFQVALEAKVLPLGMIGREATNGPSELLPMRNLPWPGWHIKEGLGLFFWVYNMAGASLTSGMNIHLLIKGMQRWLK